MPIKPILFNTGMVRALLEGRKTVTRRVVKPQPVLDGHLWKLGGAAWNDNVLSVPVMFGHSLYNRAPYQPGDVLWVRETWAENPFGEGYIYPTEVSGAGQKWRPSIHMPREAARIFLRVTGVRVERLQELTLKDAEMEGMNLRGPMFVDFVKVWNNTVQRHPNKFKRYPYCWEDNPWVWVIEFERISKEEAKHAKPE
ncbi:MAG TPA: hypothetical protein H9832_11320 [Candidatus Agathobaculum merdavium]|nr:hypothetical protein [Candidatus Agathobaculum merdavium]